MVYLTDLLISPLQSKASRDASASVLKRIKGTYSDVEDYLGIFEPLLFEEVKAHIVQVKDEEGDDMAIVSVGMLFMLFAELMLISMSGRVSVTEWQKGAVVSCEEANGFHLVSVAVLDEFREEVSENDLLILSKEKVIFFAMV